jgi:hypothetical protein
VGIYEPLDRVNLKDFDVVVMNGEGTFHSGNRHKLKGYENFIRKAKRLGKRVCLVNTSLGPGVDVSFYDFVSVRETISSRDGEFPVCPDMCFNSLMRFPTQRKGVLVTDSVVGTVTRELEKYARDQGHTFYRFERKDVGKAMELFRTAEVVITGRFHGAVLAIATGTPVIALPSNTHKVQGLMQDFGLGDCYFEKVSEMDISKARVSPRDLNELLTETENMVRAALGLPRLLSEGCCVVGNSGREKGKGRGAEIDAYDKVIRLNNFDTGEEYKEDYGIKTDYWASSMFWDVKPRKEKLELVLCPVPVGSPRFGDRYQANMGLVRQYADILKVIPDRYYAELIGRVEKPSTGMCMLYWMYREKGLTSEQVFGFSFFDKAHDHHYFDDDTECLHDGDSEKVYFEELVTGRPHKMQDVAAGVLTYREGPFLEHVLRWLVPRVKKVFVLEDMDMMFGDGEAGNETEETVRRVLDYMPEAAGVIEFHKESFGTDKGPKQEADRRNRCAALAKRAGCTWLWHVDADEFYEDGEAERLWSLFRFSVSENPRIQGVTCPMLTYWRSLHYRVEPPERHRPVVISHVDAVSSVARDFKLGTILIHFDELVCQMRHYSWARTLNEAVRKVVGWGHANTVIPGWLQDTFMTWKPGADMLDVHPTEAEAYHSIVRCDRPVPSALEDHPWNGVEFIDDLKIKVVVIHHEQPENADKLYEDLCQGFDDVELMDCGSCKEKVPKNLTVSLGNVYWQGAWKEAMRRWGKDYDVVWVVGGDITLKQTAVDYRTAIEGAYPFGCWSPAIEGRAHPFMLAQNSCERNRVRNIEGMALAVSSLLLWEIGGEFELDTKYGFGQDYWLCARARENRLANYIDGTVVVYHPERVGYSEEEAHDRFNRVFTERYGVHFRDTLFGYNEGFEGNLYTEDEEMADRVTIVTVDNGWGIDDFERITKDFDDCSRRIVMRKGITDLTGDTTAEVVDYDPELKVLLGADIAFFPKVGVANKDEFEKAVEAGVPTVAPASRSRGIIVHEKNGFIFEHESWARNWVRELIANSKLRERVRSRARDAQEKKDKEQPEDAPSAGSSYSFKETGKTENQSTEKVSQRVGTVSDYDVTVITPTFQRDLGTIRRCIDCVQLQTTNARIEHIICSDGPVEGHVKAMIEGLGLQDVFYRNTAKAKRPGDFGNTVRADMLERAKGEFILFFDDDNIIMPQYLEKMIEALRSSPANDFAVCEIVHFGPLNERELNIAPPAVLTGEPVRLYHVDPLQVLVRREIMQRVGWDVENGYLADGHTLEKLGKEGEYVKVPEILAIHI